MPNHNLRPSPVSFSSRRKQLVPGGRGWVNETVASAGADDDSGFAPGRHVTGCRRGGNS